MDTVDIFILGRYRDRPVSDPKLCDQISHPNRNLSPVSLILNQSTGLMLTTNAFKTTITNI